MLLINRMVADVNDRDFAIASDIEHYAVLRREGKRPIWGEAAFQLVRAEPLIETIRSKNPFVTFHRVVYSRSPVAHCLPTYDHPQKDKTHAIPTRRNLLRST